MGLVADEQTAVDQLIKFGDWFLKVGFVYGLGFILISALVAIFIFACWKLTLYGVDIVGTLREWLPRLFSGHWELVETCREAVKTISADSQRNSASFERQAATCERHTGDLSEIKLAMQKQADSWSRAVERLEKRSA